MQKEVAHVQATKDLLLSFLLKELKSVFQEEKNLPEKASLGFKKGCEQRKR